MTIRGRGTKMAYIRRRERWTPVKYQTQYREEESRGLA
jgi:hypothetical protein